MIQDHAMLQLLQAIDARLSITVHPEIAIPIHRSSRSRTSIDARPTNNTGQLEHLEWHHRDPSSVLLPRGRSSGNSISTIGLLLRSVTARFSLGDQDLVYRAFSTLLAWAIETTNSRLSVGVRTVATLATPIIYVDVAETFFHLACTFLVVFMIWKLATVSRSVGWAPETVIIIGLCDEVFVLDSQTFSTWEVCLHEIWWYLS